MIHNPATIQKYSCNRILTETTHNLIRNETGLQYSLPQYRVLNASSGCRNIKKNRIHIKKQGSLTEKH